MLSGLKGFDRPLVVEAVWQWDVDGVYGGVIDQLYVRSKHMLLRKSMMGRDLGRTYEQLVWSSPLRMLRLL